MKHTLFISDLHLDESQAGITHLFTDFLQDHLQDAEALYILGDLFEVWTGDDNTCLFKRRIKEQLLAVHQQNIPVYFIHGNRDFLIGKRFAKETGCRLLPELFPINLYGKNVLLAHGDLFCTKDLKHMRFRKYTRNKLFHFSILLLPLWLRNKIAKKLRKKSKQHISSIPLQMMDVEPQSVSDALKRYQASSLIHGHTHQAKITQILVNGQPAERIVLGAWDERGCALKWFENGEKAFFFFGPNDSR